MMLLIREQEKFEQGKQEEKYNRILKQIALLKELNIDNNIIIEKTTRDYEISEEEVKKHL